ncbi:SLAP domain-containing protein [Clostridium sp. LBM24168]
MKDKNSVKTKLSLLEKQDIIASDVQKEILNEEIADLPPIKEDDINISTIYAFEDSESIEVKVYFRNGLHRKVNFEYVPLTLLNSKGEIVGNKVFDLTEMGDLEYGAARPWKLFFEKSVVDMDKFSAEGCHVIFNGSMKAVKYAPVALDESSLEDEKYVPMFREFMDSLPKVHRDSVSISKFKVAIQKQGKIIVTLLIRNGCSKSVKIDKLPITVKDEKGTVIASAVFSTNGLKIESMKARVCNFAFDINMDVESSIVMDNWNVVFEDMNEQ